jgi:hypothetical protein
VEPQILLLLAFRLLLRAHHTTKTRNFHHLLPPSQRHLLPFNTTIRSSLLISLLLPPHFLSNLTLNLLHQHHLPTSNLRPLQLLAFSVANTQLQSRSIFLKLLSCSNINNNKPLFNRLLL